MLKGQFGSSVRFSERTEYFPKHPDSYFKGLANLKRKIIHSFTVL